MNSRFRMRVEQAKTYVVERNTSVRRRTRPLKPGPRFDMSEVTTREEDGHE
jgi:hypothetical protein